MAKQNASRSSFLCTLALVAVCVAACGGRSELDDYHTGIPAVVPLTDREGQRPGADAGQNGGDGDGAAPDAGSDQDSGQTQSDSGIIGPKANVGQACTQAEDCAGDNASCLTNVTVQVVVVSVPVKYPGGYCTVGCQTSADCPDNSACFTGGSQPACLATCSKATDCRTKEGYTCGTSPLPGSTDTNKYCLPPFSFPGLGGTGTQGAQSGN